MKVSKLRDRANHISMLVDVLELNSVKIHNLLDEYCRNQGDFHDSKLQFDKFMNKIRLTSMQLVKHSGRNEINYLDENEK